MDKDYEVFGMEEEDTLELMHYVIGYPRLPWRHQYVMAALCSKGAMLTTYQDVLSFFRVEGYEIAGILKFLSKCNMLKVKKYPNDTIEFCFPKRETWNVPETYEEAMKMMNEK